MAINYTAPRPTYTKTEWAKFILLRILFCPIIIWDILQFVFNLIFGGLLGSAILQAQSYDHKAVAENSEQDGLIVQSGMVNTHDGVSLNTTEVKPDCYKDTPESEQRYIIILGGNGWTLQGILSDIKQEAGKLQCNIVGFNPRGVAGSTGRTRSQKHLIIDGIAQVQRLLDKGVKPEHILLKGQSLGSAVGANVAAHFQKQDKYIKLFHGRSFSTLTNVVVGQVRTGLSFNGNDESFLLKLIGWIIKPIVWFILNICNWELDAVSAFKQIRKQDRDYICVRSPKNDRVKKADDGVISHYASLHAALRDERKDERAKIDSALKAIDELKGNRNSTPELETARQALLDARKKLKMHKMIVKRAYPKAYKCGKTGHNAPLKNFQSQHSLKTDAQTYFEEFATSSLGLARS